jgi:CRP/FNR family transcriptional regulator, cyclic AMP receptor protein
MDTVAAALALASVAASWSCWMTIRFSWWVSKETAKTNDDERTDRGGDDTGVNCPYAKHLSARARLSETDDALQALRSSGILVRTDPLIATAMSRHLRPISFPSECVVSDQRDFGGCLYVIASGRVKASHQCQDGSEIVLTILGPSEIFGVAGLFDSDAQEMSFTTLTEVLLVPIERDRLLLWMAERREVRDQLLRLFARRVKRTTTLLVDFALADTESRIASWLLMFKKRFGWQEGEVVRVVHDLTLEEFSLLVGVGSEEVGATLRDFEERAWIRVEDASVVIVDGQALRSAWKTQAIAPGVRCV